MGASRLASLVTLLRVPVRWNQTHLRSGPPQQARVELGRGGDLVGEQVDPAYLLEEPRVDRRRGGQVVDGGARPQRLLDDRDATVAGQRRLRDERLAVEPGGIAAPVQDRLGPLEGAQRLLQRLRKDRPIAIASPTLFIVVVRVGSACGNFSKAKRGTFTTT